MLHTICWSSKFRPWVYFFSLWETSLWIRHGDHLPGKRRWTEFHKKTFCEMLRNIFYTLLVVRTNFVVLSRVCCGSRIVCTCVARFIVILEFSQFFHNFFQKFQELLWKFHKVSTMLSTIILAYFLCTPFSSFKFSWMLHKISTEFLQKLSHISSKSFFRNFQKFVQFF